MRGTIILALILNSLCLLGQDTMQIKTAFVGKSVDLLVGKRFRPVLKPKILQQFGYKGFFQKYDSTAKYIGQTAFIYDSLVGDTFTCMRVTNVPWNASDFMSGDKRVLHLQSSIWGRMYYLYDTKYAHAMELEGLDDISPPVGYYCQEVTYTKDKFDGSETWRTPLLEPVAFEKTRTKAGTTYYMHLTAKYASVDGGKGVIILLKNGVKIQKPAAEVHIRVDSGAEYEANATVRLAEADIEKLLASEVTDIRLYIHDALVPQGARYKDLLKCLRKSK